MNRHKRSAILAVGLMFTVSSASLLLDVQQARGQGPNSMGGSMMGGGSMGSGMMGPGMMGQNGGSAARRQQFMTGGVPEPYASMRDPLPDTPEVLARGRKVFEENCASCHGPRGFGDGEAGRQLSPPPTNLANLAAMPMMSNGPYLYWGIAEGGTLLGTAMPAFKDALSAEDIWSAVHFLQAGLPEGGGPATK